jgi:hypothetical protein
VIPLNADAWTVILSGLYRNSATVRVSSESGTSNSRKFRMTSSSIPAPNSIPSLTASTDALLNRFLTKPIVRSSQSIRERMIKWQAVANDIPATTSKARTRGRLRLPRDVKLPSKAFAS